LLTAACADGVNAPNLVPESSPLLSYASWNGDDDGNGGRFRFDPLPASVVCGSRAATPEKPFELPPGFEQVAFAPVLYALGAPIPSTYVGRPVREAFVGDAAAAAAAAASQIATTIAPVNSAMS
jgi:hypothetical protein